MMRAVQTFLLVVLLTAMIWAWAEQSQTRALDKQTIELDVEVPPKTGFALYQDRGPVTWSHRIRLKVVADFNGQQGGISELTKLIARGEFPAAYSLPIDQRVRESLQDQQMIPLNLNKALSSDPRLAKFHVEVTSVSPPTADIRVERLKEFDDLTVVPWFRDGIDRAAVVADAKAKAVLPVGLHAQLVKENKASLQAVVQDNPTEADPGKPLTAVLATQIGGYPIKPTPETTQVTLDQSKKEYEFKSVPVKAVFARGFPWRDYELISDNNEWRKTIVVRGPASEPISADKIELFLNFDINDKEPAAGLSRDVEARLPQRFELVHSKSSPLTINFKFVKREERTGTP